MSSFVGHNRYARSQELLRRTLELVPVGSQTFSKSHEQYPQGAAPSFIARGDRGRVWDEDGNEYVDMVCGLLSILLGYRDTDVDAAVRAQLDRGVNFSLATTLEHTLAERLVEMIPCAEMVRYGKTGTDATSAAVRLARAYTGRDHVGVIGYHGWQDWYIGATLRHQGVPEAVRALTHVLPYNDIDAVHRLIREHPGDLACVVMEPMHVTEPLPDYLAEMKAVLHEAGALLVFDEIVTGFRFARGGAQELFGVTPDLATFGKGMANGLPISALVGRADIMRLNEEIFFSGTFGGEALSLAASIAVVDKIEREPVIETLWANGEKLAHGVTELIRRFGLGEVVTLAGRPCKVVTQFAEHETARAAAIRTLFIREMLANGVLILNNHNVCYAHDEDDLKTVLAAYEATFATLRAELDSGQLEQRMGIPAIEPVFRVR